MGKANEKQVAGTHYKGAIQPWDVVNDWGLGYLDGTALKYIARWRKKNGLEDIKKAIHFLEKLVEQETEEASKQTPPIGDAFPYHMALQQVQRDWVQDAEREKFILKALAEDAQALGLHNDVP
jgi:hypothetical protein